MEENGKGTKLPDSVSFHLLVAFVVAIVGVLVYVGIAPWVAAVPGLVFVLLYKTWPPKFPPMF